MGVGGGVRTVAPQGITEAQKPVLTAAQKQALEKVYYAVPELKELSVQDVADEGGKAWFVMLGKRTPGTEGGIQGAYALRLPAISIDSTGKPGNKRRRRLEDR
ncbi:Uncharacterized [Moorella glycerini]|uniref:Uncharacterized protein n=1 Tax=Neomoorella stamsii TaxID=1266720 RepID=A0A9X7P4V3_9FIRM|nr:MULTISPECIES: hypothetical protein [Moorella]PRR68979.1 hypothetical protein MOST_32610 [Moorella stamsii]CEP67600.1 Uncharacterized [Moorella glycerini]